VPCDFVILFGGESMSQAVSRIQEPAGQYLRLSAVDWHTYSRLLRAFAERPAIRLAYDRGELEIMTPLLEHDNEGRLLGRLVVALTEELGLPLKSGGSTTLRRRLRRRGIEADESFWIANAPRMAGRRRLDLRTDPPPDLVIEVDVSRSSLNRLEIYAALKVPEVWRLEVDSLAFHALRADGSYENALASLSFPSVTPGDLMRFLQQSREGQDENAVVRECRAWIRTRPGAAPR
jgi:Uma2 family endonuclease